MGVTIKGLGRLKQRTNQATKLIQEATINAMYEVTDIVQAQAVQNVQGSTKHGSSELAGSVETEVVETASKEVVGRVYTNKATGIYREFGTGPNGEKSEKDLPSGINPVYSQDPWYIPADKVPDLETLYGMPRITIQGKDYFRTNGQPARPWLYPALKQGVKEAPEILEEWINNNLKELNNR